MTLSALIYFFILLLHVENLPNSRGGPLSESLYDENICILPLLLA
jgi:hypothetical protein